MLLKACIIDNARCQSDTRLQIPSRVGVLLRRSLMQNTLNHATVPAKRRATGPSWLARQFSGSTRGIITSALVGVAGAFVGYHIALLLALGGGLLTSVIAAAAGAAVLFAWRMAR